MRTNAQTETYKNITAVSMFRIKNAGASTVTTAPVAKGDTQLAVDSVVGFADKDPLLISGDGGVELASVSGAPVAPDITTLYKLLLAQGVGAAVYLGEKVPLGYPTDSGIQFSGSLQQQAIMSAIADLPIGYIPGVAEISLNFSLLGFNVENLQLMFGQEESVIGVGTAADPYQGAVQGSLVGRAGLRVFRVEGNRADGKFFMVDFLNFIHEVSGNVQMARQAAAYPVNGKCTGIIKRVWA